MDPRKNEKSPLAKKALTALALLAALAVLLLAANPVALALSGRGDEVRQAERPTEYAGGYLWYIEGDLSTENATLDHLLTGWALLADNDTDASLSPDAQNPNKHINLLLVGDSACYSIATGVQTRPDIPENYSDEPAIKGLKHGFYREFSTLGIQNGEYELWLEVWENENLHGAFPTGWFYRMTGDGLHHLKT